MQITRRRLLGLGAMGCAVVALGGVGVGLQSSLLRTPRTPLRALSPRAYSILAAIADQVMPGDATFPAAHELGIAERIDDVMAASHPGIVRDMEHALAFLENAVVGTLLDARYKPFTQCTASEQAEVLRTWQASRIGLRQTVVKSLLSLCTATYWACPEVWAATGYPGPPAIAGAWAEPYRTPPVADEASP